MKRLLILNSLRCFLVEPGGLGYASGAVCIDSEFHYHFQQNQMGFSFELYFRSMPYFAKQTN